MSADNLVYALPFRKMTGQAVWRVLEVQMSSLEWDLCHAMTTSSRVRKFQEFEGPNAARDALAAAQELCRKLPICEYGVTALPLNAPPLTLKDLQDEAVEAGYEPQIVYAMREATDEEFGKKEIDYWANL